MERYSKLLQRDVAAGYAFGVRDSDTIGVDHNLLLSIILKEHTTQGQQESSDFTTNEVDKLTMRSDSDRAKLLSLCNLQYSKGYGTGIAAIYKQSNWCKQLWWLRRPDYGITSVLFDSGVAGRHSEDFHIDSAGHRGERQIKAGFCGAIERELWREL